MFFCFFYLTGADYNILAKMAGTEQIWGNEGNDTYKTTSGSGEDSIFTSTYGTINAGGGNNSIYAGSNSTVLAGDDNDNDTKEEKVLVACSH